MKKVKSFLASVKEAMGSMDPRKKKIAITAIIALFVGLVAAGVFAGATPDAKKVDNDPSLLEEVEDEEEVSDEADSDSKEGSSSKKANGEKGGADFDVDSLTPSPDEVVDNPTPSHNVAEETATYELRVGRVNPTVNSYSNDAFGGVTVLKNGADITASCSISYDSSSVRNVTGTYTVKIFAVCGGHSISREANVNIYVPAAGETKKTSQDKTSDAAAAQELTTIVLYRADGSRETYKKDSKENPYAYDYQVIWREGQLASNVALDGNGLTVAGRHFTKVA